MKTKSRGAGLAGRRKDRIVQEFVHDTYKARGKLMEPSWCPECGSVYQKGRWSWGEKPQKVHREICPACHRIGEKYPAGFVKLRGPFFNRHREEALNLVYNEESEAIKEHPLCRIMGVEKEEDGVLITTTDIHLPRRIGEALRHAYQGALQIRYGEGSHFIRVTWER